MIGGGRITGLALMIGSAVVLVVGIMMVVTATGISGGGVTVGVFLAVLICAPLFGIGFYLFRKGQSEQSQFAFVKQEKKILNMVLTQGQVSMGELVSELEMPSDQIKEMIRDLVGKQLFSGAINWDKGILYSVESQQLTDGRKCPNCGGQVEFAGKGVIVCPFCGSEVFLTKRAAASTT